MPEDCWTYKPKDSEWALVEIICHLRDVDKEINLPRIQTILAEDNPFLPAIDSDAWAKERNYINQNGLKALQDFNQVRISILDILAQLNQSVWSKPTRHTLFGPTQFSEIIRFIAGHDRLHIRQLTQHYQGIGAEVQLWDISQKSLN
jgi:DNA phosphorothioation-dependent restriction protein DptG